MNEPTGEEIAWAAGLFEGEGCISNAGKRSVPLTINSTDRDVLERFQEIVGCGGIYAIRRREQKAHHKEIWQWQVTARDEVTRILESFLPWLQTRRSMRALEALARLKENQGLNGDKTHCNRGHPLSGDNLYIRQGRRGCRTCKRRMRMESYHRVKARTHV